MRVLIVGGTGSLSSRITEKALKLGHEVAVFSRGVRPAPGLTGAQLWVGNRENLRDFSEKITDFAPEVVVDSICFHPDRAQDLVELFPSARRVILISTVDVYGEDIGAMPVEETRVPSPATGYARGKYESEKVVLRGLGERATIFRPSHILGRTFLTASLWGRSPYWVDRIARGKPIVAIDGGCNLVTPVHALDAAEWIVRSFELRAADGQIFNAVGAEIIALRRYLRSIALALGCELQMLPVSSLVFQQTFDAARQFSYHRPYSSAKAERLLGYRAQSSIEAMMKETVDYMQANNLVQDCSAQPQDDKLVAHLEAHGQQLQRWFASSAFDAPAFFRKEQA